MFPNGYNIPYYVPYNNIGNMAMGMSGPALRGLGTTSKAGGLLSKLGIGRLKSINWQGLLNNTSRTLGVINQAIPLVKQIGPMYNNMKSMLRVVSLFKDETDPPKKAKKNNTINNINTTTTENTVRNENTITNNSYSNSPNFFI